MLSVTCTELAKLERYDIYMITGAAIPSLDFPFDKRVIMVRIAGNKTLIQKYDDSSPYMFGKVINAKKEILDKLSTLSSDINNTVILFNRVNKLPFLNTYFVDKQHVIAVMSIDEFNNL